jgi:hypothetical protein
VDRTVDDVVAAVLSLSGSAPHLFGDQEMAFEAELRHLLTACADRGHFSERLRDAEIVIWRP